MKLPTILIITLLSAVCMGASGPGSAKSPNSAFAQLAAREVESLRIQYAKLWRDALHPLKLPAELMESVVKKLDPWIARVLPERWLQPSDFSIHFQNMDPAKAATTRNYLEGHSGVSNYTIDPASGVVSMDFHGTPEKLITIVVAVEKFQETIGARFLGASAKGRKAHIELDDGVEMKETYVKGSTYGVPRAVKYEANEVRPGTPKALDDTTTVVRAPVRRIPVTQQ